MRRFRRTLRSLSAVAKETPYRPPGHYLALVPLRLEATGTTSSDPNQIRVHLTEFTQRHLAKQLLPLFYRYAREPWRTNSTIGRGGAFTYRTFLEHIVPVRILEAESGYSTAVPLDTCDQHGPVDITCIKICIEPHPKRLDRVMHDGDKLTLIEQQVQAIDGLTVATSDVLFIDSTHNAKTGSDLNHFIVEGLPPVQPSMSVHFDDALWPSGYPKKWLKERRGQNRILGHFLPTTSDGGYGFSPK